jgi:hypothetical protein
MTDPMKLIWPLLDLPGATLTVDAVMFWPSGMHQQLLKMGVLIPTTRAERVLCPECRDHFEDVLAIPGPGGRLRYAITCPEHMRVTLSPDDLRQWIVDMNHVATIIASAFQLTGKLTELAPGRIWRLGRWKYKGQIRDMLLAVGLNQPDAIDVRRQITASKRPVVFVSMTGPSSEFWAGQKPPLIRLTEVVSLVDGTLDINTAEVVGLIHDADVPVKENLERLNFLVDQRIRSALDSKLTEDQIIQAYVSNGSSARKAATDLNNRGLRIHHSTVSRTVKKHNGSLRTGSSKSVVRTRSPRPRTR